MVATTQRTRTMTRSAATRASDVILLGVPAGLAHADAGDLDLSVDGDGKRALNYGGGGVARAIMVQRDGKSLGAGLRRRRPGPRVRRLWRFRLCRPRTPAPCRGRSQSNDRRDPWRAA
jgi:hypothetical protein